MGESLQQSIRIFWPVFIAIVISVAAYAGTVTTVQDTKDDVKQIQQTYVTKEILELKLIPIQQSQQRIEEQLSDITEKLDK